jgi:hypothetical protein
MSEQAIGKQERPLWERFDGESAEAWEAFVQYRDMGPSRSLAKLGKLLGKIRQNFDPWAAKFSWQIRVRAWEDEIDRRNRDENANAILDMRKRHAQLAVMMQNKIVARLGTIKPEDLSARDCAIWLTEAAKLERLSRGEPGEHVQVDVSNLSDEELIAEVMNDPALRVVNGGG